MNNMKNLEDPFSQPISEKEQKEVQFKTMLSTALDSMSERVQLDKGSIDIKDPGRAASFNTAYNQLYLSFRQEEEMITLYLNELGSDMMGRRIGDPIEVDCDFSSPEETQEKLTQVMRQYSDGIESMFSEKNE